ncbi:hypothetical protein [Pelagerythrobacter rhizovicinus]|uniref:Uncharacterized protein n=1 Tax=Pelagerythrobacter rhizovicinus TaxID=2268576 RepID=A0A4Q2KLM6_9SPHN|nr:hypothetical protein [Pelagerythrobacter rhizovicinus]RXZ64041.1 hypothetical protein ETX26_08880 [Pelagerythrobacter rhizovicinus]
MMTVGSRMRQIGWAVVLSICLAGFVVLTFRVNAVKSQVRLAERQIIALERENLLLETEFETRANQQQLANWNRVEFGYQAPRADQFLDNERELAALGLPRAIGGPEPIRVARAPAAETASFPRMVSPVAGHSAPAEDDHPEGEAVVSTRSLADRLSGTVAFETAFAEFSE